MDVPLVNRYPVVPAGTPGLLAALPAPIFPEPSRSNQFVGALKTPSSRVPTFGVVSPKREPGVVVALGCLRPSHGPRMPIGHDGGRSGAGAGRASRAAISHAQPQRCRTRTGSTAGTTSRSQWRTCAPPGDPWGVICQAVDIAEESLEVQDGRTWPRPVPASG